MAQILEKAFDATKKIARTIFLGSPNLFTTSDINRQGQQTRYELDCLGDSVGAASDFSATFTPTVETAENPKRGTLSTSYNYIRYRGCSFTPTNLSGVSISMSGNFYVYLLAKKKVVEYADDSTHEIAGAKFADGTTAQAANQEVYYDEKLVVSDNATYAETGYETLTRLGMFSPVIPSRSENPAGDILSFEFDSLCTSRHRGILSTPIDNVSPLTGDFAVGDTIRTAVRRVIKKFQSFGTLITNLSNALDTLTDRVDAFTDVKVLYMGTQFQCPIRLVQEGSHIFLYSTSVSSFHITWGNPISNKHIDVVAPDNIRFTTPTFYYYFKLLELGISSVIVDGSEVFTKRDSAKLVVYLCISVDSNTGDIDASLQFNCVGQTAVDENGNVISLAGKECRYDWTLFWVDTRSVVLPTFDLENPTA